MSFGSHALSLGRAVDLYAMPTRITRPSRRARAQMRSSENGVQMRSSDYDFLEDQEPDIRTEEDTLCPFGTPILGDVCTQGCMACNDGVRCCSIGESCDVTTQCLQDPDTKQCPYASYLPACMMCNNSLGEPTLKRCTPGSDETCTATTFCTAYAKSDRVKPQSSAAMAADPARQKYAAQRAVQDVQFERMVENQRNAWISDVYSAKGRNW